MKDTSIFEVNASTVMRWHKVKIFVYDEWRVVACVKEIVAARAIEAFYVEHGEKVRLT